MSKPTNITDPNEFEDFPCDCHRLEYAYTDSLCPMCEEQRLAMWHDTRMEDAAERKYCEGT